MRRVGTVVRVAALVTAVTVLGSCTTDEGFVPPTKGTATTEANDRPDSGAATETTKPRDLTDSNGATGTTEKRVPGPVPDLAGVSLPAAVNELRDIGYVNLESIDATGQGRVVDGVDSWVVAAQSIPPRAVVSEDVRVILFVHRSGERSELPSALGFAQVPDLLYHAVGEAATSLLSVGISHITFDDYSGKGRIVDADDSWTVLYQNPVAGTWTRQSDPVILSALPTSEIPGD